jgi:hypothetical protein
MKTNLLTGSNRAKLVTCLLLMLYIAAVGQVNAASIFCRSDPIVYLSDGTRLQFNTEIATSLDDVIGIRYELHVPIGVGIDRINFTPSWARSKETVVLVADQAAGSYEIITLAQTGSANVATTVKAMKVSKRNGGEGSTHTSATGLSGQAITVTF